MQKGDGQSSITGSYIGTDEYGSRIWFYDGVRHRTDGPAVISEKGFKEWYLHGRPYSEIEFLSKISKEDLVKYILNNKNF